MDIDKRFERILAIFIQLQAKPVVRAQDLADKFQVSIRTIYRDIKSLEKAGVPIYSEAGYGYALAGGYRLPPTLFSKDEALSFAVAEKLMHQYLDKELSKQFSNALSKMKSVLRTSDKENIQTVEDQVVLKSNRKLFNQEVPTALSTLFSSIAQKLQVNIKYQKADSNNAEERTVEPVGVFQENGYWYFMAYCHLRKEVRQFRLDRIKTIGLTTEPFQQKLKSLAFYLEQKVIKKEILPTATIWATKQMQAFMCWERQLYGFIKETEKNDGFEMIFEHNPKNQYLQRWLLAFGDGIKIMEPESLKQEMLQLIAAIQQQIK
ncbi:MAG: YafY family transcriptional regulator [Chryseobacterium sp.]|nr:MAG: YafY family transcriptional regulator [Chryseobacterium sp.]